MTATNQPYSLAELMICAASEAFADDGEVLATGIGVLQRLAASLAMLNSNAELMMTDSEAFMVAEPVPLGPRGGYQPKFDSWMGFSRIFDNVWSGKRHALVGPVQIDRFGHPSRRRGAAEALLDQAAQVVFIDTQHAAELHTIDGMRRKQHVAHANAAWHRLGLRLDVVVPAQVVEMIDRLADVDHRQRLLHPRIDQAADERIGDDLSLLLDDDLLQIDVAAHGGHRPAGPPDRRPPRDQERARSDEHAGLLEFAMTDLRESFENVFDVALGKLVTDELGDVLDDCGLRELGCHVMISFFRARNSLKPSTESRTL